MRRLLGVLAALVLIAGPAEALQNTDATGPEPPDDHASFNVEITVGNIGPKIGDSTIQDQIVSHFEESAGWDFGDRNAYRCASAEFFVGTDERFELVYHAVSDYRGALQINDRFGREDEDGGTVEGDCWEYDRLPRVNPKTGEVAFRDFFADGSDHFPHMIHPGDGVSFYQNGVEIAHLELSTGECELLYWVPGNDPGEAWLWWDEDGPTSSHEEGEGDLPCAGGPMEPVALVQIKPRHLDAGISVCTVSLHEQLCSEPVPLPTPITLGSGQSVLTCPDGSVPAVESTVPLRAVC